MGIVFKNQNTRDIVSKVQERRRVVALSSAALVSATGHGVPSQHGLGTSRSSQAHLCIPEAPAPMRTED